MLQGLCYNEDMKGKATGKKKLHTPPQEFAHAEKVRSGAVWQAKMKLDREKYDAGIREKMPSHRRPLTLEEGIYKQWR